jgi:hypothetical protein
VLVVFVCLRDLLQAWNIAELYRLGVKQIDYSVCLEFADIPADSFDGHPQQAGDLSPLQRKINNGSGVMPGSVRANVAVFLPEPEDESGHLLLCAQLAQNSHPLSCLFQVADRLLKQTVFEFRVGSEDRPELGSPETA